MGTGGHWGVRDISHEQHSAGSSILDSTLGYQINAKKYIVYKVFDHLHFTMLPL